MVVFASVRPLTWPVPQAAEPPPRNGTGQARSAHFALSRRMWGKQSSDRGFGFHLPAGLLINRDGAGRQIWFGTTAFAQNGGTRRRRRSGSAGKSTDKSNGLGRTGAGGLSHSDRHGRNLYRPRTGRRTRRPGARQIAHDL